MELKLPEFAAVDKFCQIHPSVMLNKFINLYGCTIDEGSKVGTFVEIQKKAQIGKFCKIGSHSFICEGVHIGDQCFIGHSVVFINDNRPQAFSSQTGELERDNEWRDRFCETLIENKVTIGSNSTILGGIKIGEGAMIGAGSVVTKDVPAYEIWAGNPAKKLRGR